MRISRSVFLLSSLTSFAFSAVEGGRKLKKAKKTGAPTSAPTPSPSSALTPDFSSSGTDDLVFLPPLEGTFTDVNLTFTNEGDASGIGARSIVFAKGELFGAQLTLTISYEVTSATSPGTSDTVLATAQFCFFTQDPSAGCATFESSSLFPFDASSGTYPRSTFASSSGTGIFLYDNPAFLHIKEGSFADGVIRFQFTFTTPTKDIFALFIRNERLAATVPGFCPPEVFEGGQFPFDDCVDLFAESVSLNGDGPGDELVRSGKLMAMVMGGGRR